jgi:hypothetical protein
MKNIKGIQRKAKYEVQSIEVLDFGFEGFGKFMSANIRLRRLRNEDVDSFMRYLVVGEESNELDGKKPYFITVSVPVRQWARKNRSHKPNDWRDRTISTLAIDEIEAYNLAKRAIQAYWQKAFKLNRYARR